MNHTEHIILTNTTHTTNITPLTNNQPQEKREKTHMFHPLIKAQPNKVSACSTPCVTWVTKKRWKQYLSPLLRQHSVYTEHKDMRTLEKFIGKAQNKTKWMKTTFSRAQHRDRETDRNVWEWDRHDCIYNDINDIKWWCFFFFLGKCEKVRQHLIQTHRNYT